MSARDAIAKGCATTKDQNGAWAIGRGTHKRADAILFALREMPLADRIAHAREIAGLDWAVVPRVATQAMVSAAASLDFSAQHDPTWPEYYAAMLAASEKEPSQ